MENDDEECDDELDDYDTLQNEYEYLFNDFEKFRHKCKDFKKIIFSFTLDLENARNEYEIVIENRKITCKKVYENAKFEIEALRL